MKFTSKARLIGGLSFISLFIFVLLTATRHTVPKPGKNGATAVHKIKAEKDTLAAGVNLYYLEHPYLTKAIQVNEERKYDSSILYFKEASEKFERERLWENYVWVNGYIARLYLYVRGMNYEDAFPYLQKVFEKGEKYIGGNHPYMAVIHYYLGVYYYNRMKPEESLKALHKALEILTENYSTDNIHSSDIYEYMGNVYADLLIDNTSAETYYLKSIHIKEALPGEEKFSYLTRSYYNLMYLKYMTGDFEKAQSLYYEALKNVPYVKHHKAHWLELLEAMLASIYGEQQMFRKAIAKLNNTIAINLENNGDKGLLAFYNNSLGNIYSKNALYDSAIFHYKRALSLTKDNSSIVTRETEAATANFSLGMTYLRLENYSTALDYLNRSLALRLKNFGKKNGETALAYQGIGNVYLEAGQPDSALYYFQAGLAACTKNYNDTGRYAVPLASNVINSFLCSRISRNKASALKQLYGRNPSDNQLLTASLASYCLADSLMTRFRSLYDRENAKLAFTKNNNSIYEEAIDCAALLYRETNDSKYHDRVFDFMDKRKSGLLLEALTEEEFIRQTGIPVEDGKNYELLQKEFAFLQSRLEKENNKEEPAETVMQALHTRMNTTEAKIKAFREKFRKNHPDYADFRSAADMVRLRDLHRFSIQNNVIMLEYFWGEKAVYALGIYQNKSILLKMEKDSTSEAHFRSLQSGLTKGYVFATRASDFVTFQKSSYYVYNSLVEPVLAAFRLPVKENKMQPGIIVVPDGPLSSVPFEALVTAPAAEKEADYRKLNYLVKSYTISYNYSARFILKKYRHMQTDYNPRVLALSYSGDKIGKRHSGSLRTFRNMNTELPGSVKELKAISACMDGRFYMGEEATEYIFKKEAPHYDILHLAVHGKTDSLNNYSSRLIFKKGNDSLNDGNLYAYEINNMPIKARLAVLSACESGLGKLNPGEGMFSMARGFVQAGCPSVVMSLWMVNDLPAANIMKDFYKHLSEGGGIDRSIRMAKLEYINGSDRRSAHPANWAAYVGMGKMAPVMKGSSPEKPGIIAAIVLFISAGALLAYRKINRKRTKAAPQALGTPADLISPS